MNTSSTFESTKLHERPGLRSQVAAAAVTMDTDIINMSLRDGLVRKRIPNHAENEGQLGQTDSNSDHIRDKKNVEWL